MSGPDVVARCGGACSRRGFVVRSLGVLAAIALPAGCASAAVTPVRVEGGVVRVRLTDHPALARPGGHVRLRPDGVQSQVYILALDDGFAALSPVCTHLGCTVDVQGEVLVCPCHGSTYDREGRVLRGPAERRLRSFPVRADAGVLSIALGAS